MTAKRKAARNRTNMQSPDDLSSSDSLARIRQSVPLRSLPPEEVRRRLNSGDFLFRSYGRNQILHFAGDACVKLEIILRGHVRVERIDPDGDMMAVSDIYRDDLLGGNLLFSRQAYYPLTITSRELTTVLEIAREPLFELLSAYPPFLRDYLQYVADHTTLLSERIRYNVRQPLRESVLAYLRNEAMLQDSSRIELPMSKKALAERLGVQRTSLSRELAKMRRDGLIDLDRATVRLLTPATARSHRD